MVRVICKRPLKIRKSRPLKDQDENAHATPTLYELILVQISLPVARRSNGDCCTGSSPGSGSSRSQTFPRRQRRGKSVAVLPITGAGPRRHQPGFPITPSGHLHRYIKLSANYRNSTSLASHCQVKFLTIYLQIAIILHPALDLLPVMAAG